MQTLVARGPKISSGPRPWGQRTNLNPRSSIQQCFRKNLDRQFKLVSDQMPTIQRDILIWYFLKKPTKVVNLFNEGMEVPLTILLEDWKREKKY